MILRRVREVIVEVVVLDFFISLCSLSVVKRAGLSCGKCCFCLALLDNTLQNEGIRGAHISQIAEALKQLSLVSLAFQLIELLLCHLVLL